MADTKSQHRLGEPASAGRDELNLIDFPIAVLQYQQPTDRSGSRPDELVSTVQSFDADLGRTVPRTLTRRTSSKHGFPTPLEEEVLIGLLTLSRLKTEFTSPRVEFTEGEFFELVRWPSNGQSSRRLAVALDRLAGLSLKYENAWTTAAGTFEKEFSTRLLESYKLIRQTKGRPPKHAPRNAVHWASEVFEDIQRGNVKELDTTVYFGLRLPISRRMYRFLDKHFADGPRFAMDLITFASHLGLSETSHVGKIKERLAPGVAELESLATFIAPAEAEGRYRKEGPGRWTVRFERSQVRKQVAGKPQPSPAASSNAATLVRRFYEAWSGNAAHAPTWKEIDQAKTVLDRFGEERSDALVAAVVKVMKRKFPDAQAFGATMLYWHEADRLSRRGEQRPTEDPEPTSDATTTQRQARRERWNALAESEQERLADRVRSRSGGTLRRLIDQGKLHDPLVIGACLAELDRQLPDAA